MERRRLLLLLAAATAVCVSLAPGAAATRLRWHETARDGKTAVLRFEVDSVTFGSSRWTAHVSIRNLSSGTVRIGDRFGVAIYAGAHTFDLRRAIGFAYATTFSPARPVALRPGAVWTGTIGGYGKLKPSRAKRYARVVFGPLSGVPGRRAAVFWITNHALTLAPTANKPVI